MAQRLWTVVVVLMNIACSQDRSAAVAGRIPDIPENQQRVVTRGEFEWRWPFTGGVGTLGCASDAVVFRFDGVTYAVNDTAKSRGFVSIEPIRLTQSSGWPRDPLKRLPQDQRKQIFARFTACERHAARDPTGAAQCTQRLRQAHGLSAPELKQIEVEGLERLWPPLPPKRVSLEPMIEAGRKLCRN